MSQRIITLALNREDLPLIRNIEAAKIVNNADGSGYDPEGATPLSSQEAEALMDAEGYASVVMEVSLDGFAHGLADTTTEYDIYDTLHDLAFKFGLTEDSTYEVLGVASNSSSLIIRYTTHIAPHLADEAEEGARA